MGTFDYKRYLKMNWLLREAKAPKQKELFKTRQKRQKEGNWKGSVGKFVETHSLEIQQAYASKKLFNYVKTEMIPTLEEEAQKYMEEKLEQMNHSSLKLLDFLFRGAFLSGEGIGIAQQGLRKE